MGRGAGSCGPCEAEPEPEPEPELELEGQFKWRTRGGQARGKKGESSAIVRLVCRQSVAKRQERPPLAARETVCSADGQFASCCRV